MCNPFLQHLLFFCDLSVFFFLFLFVFSILFSVYVSSVRVKKNIGLLFSVVSILGLTNIFEVEEYYDCLPMSFF